MLVKAAALTALDVNDRDDLGVGRKERGKLGLPFLRSTCGFQHYESALRRRDMLNNCNIIVTRLRLVVPRTRSA